MELQAEQVNVNIERGTVIITGYDIDEIISEIGTETLLQSMDYSDIMEYVTEVENDKADEAYDFRTAHEV